MIQRINCTAKSILCALAVFILFTGPVLANMPGSGKYAGKIVFAESWIPKEDPDESEFRTGFSLMDNIYARIYLDEPLGDVYEKLGYSYNFNEMKYTYNYAIRMFVDDELTARWLYEMDEEPFRKQTTFNLVIASDKDDKLFYNWISEWIQEVERLGHGTFRIRLDVIPLYSDIVNSPDKEPVSLCSGEFTYRIDSTRMADFVREKMPGLPKATVINPGIQESILDASTSVYAGAVPVRAVLVDVNSDWRYNVDEFGNTDIMTMKWIAKSWNDHERIQQEKIH